MSMLAMIDEKRGHFEQDGRMEKGRLRGNPDCIREVGAECDFLPMVQQNHGAAGKPFQTGNHGPFHHTDAYKLNAHVTFRQAYDLRGEPFSNGTEFLHTVVVDWEL